MFGDGYGIEFGIDIPSLGTLYEARPRGVPGGPKLENRKLNTSRNSFRYIESEFDLHFVI